MPNAIEFSSLTDTIYMGTSKKAKNGLYHWQGKKTDVTQDAIRAVFHYMYSKAEETGYYEITLPKYGSMSLTRKENSDG